MRLNQLILLLSKKLQLCNLYLYMYPVAIIPFSIPLLLFLFSPSLYLLRFQALNLNLPQQNFYKSLYITIIYICTIHYFQLYIFICLQFTLLLSFIKHFHFILYSNSNSIYFSSSFPYSFFNTLIYTRDYHIYNNSLLSRDCPTQLHPTILDQLDRLTR